MKSFHRNLLILASVALTGCSTIHFHNDKSATGRTAEEWHHDGIFGLVEFSDPVMLSNRCSGGWTKVTTEKTAIQGIVTLLTAGLYDPWNVKYTCTMASGISAKETLGSEQEQIAPKSSKRKKRKHR